MKVAENEGPWVGIDAEVGEDKREKMGVEVWGVMRWLWLDAWVGRERSHGAQN